MNKKREILFATILPAIGSVAGALVWLMVYSANRNPVFGFDGPAGFGLLLSVTAGCLIFSVVAVILCSKQKSVNTLLLLLIFCSGLTSGYAVSYATAQYAMNHFIQNPYPNYP